MPSPVRHDDVLLRLIKDVNDIRANLRRVVANLPLYDIANENTPAQLTVNQNDYPPGNYDILMLSADHNVTITGITNGVKGRRLQLFNVGSYSIILSHENTASLAQNRFRFQTGFSASLDPNTNLTVYYYDAAQRWITGTEIFDVAGLWTLRTCPTGSWQAVTWSSALNLFVAVGYTGVSGPPGQIMTSPDGIVWTSQVCPANVTQLFGVCWSSTLNLFVAVGIGSGVGGLGAVITSSDGVNWTAQTPAFNTTFNGVAWSASLGMFVAVGGDNSTDSTANKIMTSVNGTAWVSRTSAQTKVWNAIVWASEIGKFVTAGGGGTKDIAYSSDGINWTGIAVSPASRWGALAWSPAKSLFVALRTGSAFESYSSDGITWSTPIATPIAMNGIAWSPEIGIFLGVYFSSANSYYSSDGINWVLGSNTPTSQIVDLCWSPERNIFVAVGTDKVMTTP